MRFEISNPSCKHKNLNSFEFPCHTCNRGFVILTTILKATILFTSYFRLFSHCEAFFIKHARAFSKVHFY